MGCWSESCLLSGLEIRNDDECGIVALGFQDDYRGIPSKVILSPILWGKYTDYGTIVPHNIDIDHWVDMYGCTGVDWKNKKALEEGDLRPIEVGEYNTTNKTISSKKQAIYGFISKEAFDVAKNMQVEVWDRDVQEIKYRSLFDNTSILTKQYTDSITAVAKEIYDEINSASEPLSQKETLTIISTATLSLRMRSYDPVPWQGSLSDIFWDTEKLFKLDVDKLFNDMVDVKILDSAMFHLRRGYTSNIHGEQHGGTEELNHFYKEMVKITDKRIAEDKEMWGE